MYNNNNVSLVDCPRDAIQGIKNQIPTQKKIAYINQLIESKLFDCIDFGSFVSPKAVPQLSDTVEVINGLEKNDQVKLLAIIANIRGAEIGSQIDKIDYLGYPFSISETFQKNNTNANIAQAFETVKEMLDIINKGNQELVVYISMAFGNPYGDHWDMDLVSQWVSNLKNIGVKNFSIADTTSEATPESIHDLFHKLTKEHEDIPFSVHLHSPVESALLKIDAAYAAGCRRFEGAILGYGGCPFAKDELVGNIPSELLVDRFGKGSFEDVSKLMQGFQNLINNEL
ncbi:hydroxymethylglutaryl-CoA lyase [Sphingobacterium daejeonense]|jgi:hydroxymethylglutaryl-CoA lyase|uniref:hydroxymethylglutaryl-CoA lyase n=1 Tax=Sphingobacterium daejeonense TaxID=371142 RepID=UPI0021A7B052|nr:hydroxymethylglutaryl-CoA lyase [Sphingobacterium daejeonense]MCT1530589.1 hydroxymethylglutaryl-CoA lyase [Sphingobacterium daejeonense]